MKKIHLFSLILAFSAQQSCAVSFDCAKAGTPNEKLICSDTKISALDEQLASSYKTALEAATDKDAIKKQQVEWLKQQRACKDAACLAQAYQARIEQLNNPVAVAESTPSHIETAKAPEASSTASDEKPITIKFVHGDSYPLCKPYLDMLNAAHYSSTKELACERKILPQFQKFKAIAWVKMNDKKEIEETMEKNINIEYSKSNSLNNGTHKSSLLDMKKRINDGITEFYSYKVDIDKDGVEDKIYKVVYQIPEMEEYKQCKSYNYFFIDNPKITLDNAGNYRYAYTAFNYNGNNELFIFNGDIYASHWTGKHINEGINLAIYAVNTEKTCGFLVK